MSSQIHDNFKIILDPAVEIDVCLQLARLFLKRFIVDEKFASHDRSFMSLLGLLGELV